MSDKLKCVMLMRGRKGGGVGKIQIYVVKLPKICLGQKKNSGFAHDAF